MINSKSNLAIALSKLKVFAKPDARLEQYPTDSEVAAETLWSAYMSGDIDGKIIADLGCGTGILGIGAMMLGAKHVTFVDKDYDALLTLKNNLKSLAMKKGFKIINKGIDEFNNDVDVVIENPPFGTREKHIDAEFLEVAMQHGKVVYSFHKTSTADFVIKLASDNNFSLTGRWNFAFPLKQTQKFHEKRIQRIEVSCFRFEKG